MVAFLAVFIDVIGCVPMTDAQDLLQTRLKAVEEAASARAMVVAVQDLAALQAEGAIDMLIRVLGYNNPGAAVAAVEGLIKLGTPAASVLLNQIDGYNYGARAWALRALSIIGDPRGLDLIRETAAEDFSLSVRRAAARGLGNIQWAQLASAQRKESQMKARDTLLVIVVKDPEWVVRYGAIAGLQGVATAALTDGWAEVAEPIAQGLRDRTLHETVPAVRARAHWALSHFPELAAL